MTLIFKNSLEVSSYSKPITNIALAIMTSYPLTLVQVISTSVEIVDTKAVSKWPPVVNSARDLGRLRARPRLMRVPLVPERKTDNG